MESSLGALTGVPSKYFYIEATSTAEAEVVWEHIKSALDNGYLVGAGTSGGDDSEVNSCNIALGH